MNSGHRITDLCTKSWDRFTKLTEICRSVIDTALPGVTAAGTSIRTRLTKDNLIAIV
jgi:hypothetical protein